ncbi:hypothetical protein [Catellatospora sichuanensis]|uniref:hypothetical protein n=1 Tax=Catellatospora sichuanensis TaxID=1969805 RepID=UPI0011827B43|nr:hypothetical protein [Catellatospora sichuanensis]
MAKKVKDLRVTLEAIRCTNSSGDSGANLEIFGQLEVRGVFIDNQANPQPGAGSPKVMWSRRESDGGMNIAPNTEFVVDKSVILPVFERDFLWLGGRIVEEDDFVDDVLGNHFLRIKYENIKPETVSVVFNSEDQEVVARYKVEVLAERVEQNA